MKYPNLVMYIRGMYEESGAKEGGWSDDEIVTDLMRFTGDELQQAEESLSLFGPELSRNMGYYNLGPQGDDGGEFRHTVGHIGEVLAS